MVVLAIVSLYRSQAMQMTLSLTIAAAGALLSVGLAAGASIVAKGSLPLKLTKTGPANLLPPFTALSPGGESIEHLEPSIVPQVLFGECRLTTGARAVPIISSSCPLI